MRGAYHAAIFNVFRRTRNQVLYWAPALMVGYYTMQWATERYVEYFLCQSGGLRTLERGTRCRESRWMFANECIAGMSTSTRRRAELSTAILSKRRGLGICLDCHTTNCTFTSGADNRQLNSLVASHEAVCHSNISSHACDA